MCRIKRILKSDKGEANYISTVAYIFVAVVILAFILNLFSIISVKQQLNHCADQMMKQIQLSGGVNSDTEELFNYLSGEIRGVANIEYDADTYRSQRETDMGEYIRTLYSSSSYIRQLEQAVEDGLSEKVSLNTEDYCIRNIHLEFSEDGGDQIAYIFTCDAEFYVTRFGNRYPAITKTIRLTGHHNTKF